MRPPRLLRASMQVVQGGLCALCLLLVQQEKDSAQARSMRGIRRFERREEVRPACTRGRKEDMSHEGRSDENPLKSSPEIRSEDQRGDHQHSGVAHPPITIVKTERSPEGT